MHTIVDIIKTSDRDQTHQTPDEILDIVKLIDPIILDPCADMDRQFAEYNFTELQDGLVQDWAYLAGGPGELVYANPPYNKLLSWVEKMIYEASYGVQIVFLGPVKAPKWFMKAWRSANAVCFWEGRITFVGSAQGAFFDSLFFYWGEQPYKFCEVFEPYGLVERLR